VTARDDEEGGPAVLEVFWVQLYAAMMGALLRALDVVTLLLLRPSLLGAYARVWRGTAAESPYPMHTFEKVQAAKRRGVSVRELVYGETAVFTAVRAFRRAGVTKGSVVVDVGAGRGRALLAARALGAEARGADLLESHVTHAQRALAGTGVTVEHADAVDVPLDDATHVYVTWTCLSEATRAAVRERLRATAPGTRVLTLTLPIEDDAFSVDGSLVGWFTWGLERVWLHTRR
jgi:SAM-dependent methyltransferase